MNGNERALDTMELHSGQSHDLKRLKIDIGV